MFVTLSRGRAATQSKNAVCAFQITYKTQTTFFWPWEIPEEMNRCSSITKDSIYHIKRLTIQPYHRSGFDLKYGWKEEAVANWSKRNFPLQPVGFDRNDDILSQQTCRWTTHRHNELPEVVHRVIQQIPYIISCFKTCMRCIALTFKIEMKMKMELNDHTWSTLL